MTQHHPANQERRKHPRLLKNIPLKISSGDFDIVTETMNISLSGTNCQVNKYIEPMTKLQIHFLLPFKRQGRNLTKKVTCSGVVVRTEAIAGSSDYNVAIYFNEIQKRSVDIIEEYVNSTLKEREAEPSA